MLILSRKINEEILIGSTIRVIVHKVNGQKVKLGFAAPPGCCHPSERDPRW